ncbi:hypothetical protein IE53DRAFT_371867 [Violaceomyces palustris]|uniref:Uncharacterized protein n=1 Tax=Violaceomyces palustris TaxID=1673888 RepID=A0ACD0NMD7_9BASI|nr:hypothetical protein IE53DRAFT_371867 [Violaceomyces palustris]
MLDRFESELSDYLSDPTTSSKDQLLSTLTSLSSTLASDPDQRGYLSSDADRFEKLITQDLKRLWDSHLQLESTFSNEQRSSEVGSEAQVKRSSSIALVVALVRLLRNSMAQCIQAQRLVYRNKATLEPILIHTTSFHSLSDPALIPLSRSLAQLLSNLITSNPELQKAFWNEHVVIQGSPERRFPLRLLSSTDHSTQVATQVLLVNLLKSQDEQASHERCQSLVESDQGLSVLHTLLNLAEAAVLEEEEEEEEEEEMRLQFEVQEETRSSARILGQVEEVEMEGKDTFRSELSYKVSKKDPSETLGLIYSIFTLLFSQGLCGQLLERLGPRREEEEEEEEEVFETSDQEDQIISSSQLTFLRLFDSWIHFASIESSASSQQAEFRCGGRGGLDGLANFLVRLCRFAEEAMKRGMDGDQRKEDLPQDKRLIGVHQALILVLKCLITVGLIAGGWSGSQDDSPFPEMTKEEGQEEDPQLGPECRRMLTSLRQDAEVVESCVDHGLTSVQLESRSGGSETQALLHRTALYSPALSPFRARPGSKQESFTTYQDVPEGHAFSSTGKATNLSEASDPPSTSSSAYGFDHLKRDLIRFLGVLVYSPVPIKIDETFSDVIPRSSSGVVGKKEYEKYLTKSQVRKVQDRVRRSNGLFDVMNMTVLDERNPYMREHAIFTLKYLLAGNKESQDLVSQLRPVEPQ